MTHSVHVDRDGSMAVFHDTLSAPIAQGGDGEVQTTRFNAASYATTQSEMSDYRRDMYRSELMDAAVKCAAGMLAHGKTRSRDPEYIASKSVELARALIDKVNAAVE